MLLILDCSHHSAIIRPDFTLMEETQNPIMTHADTSALWSFLWAWLWYHMMNPCMKLLLLPRFQRDDAALHFIRHHLGARSLLSLSDLTAHWRMFLKRWKEEMQRQILGSWFDLSTVAVEAWGRQVEHSMCRIGTPALWNQLHIHHHHRFCVSDTSSSALRGQRSSLWPPEDLNFIPFENIPTNRFFFQK